MTDALVWFILFGIVCSVGIGIFSYRHFIMLEKDARELDEYLDHMKR